MYIAQTGQASKAAVYSTLNATWTIVFGLVRGEYEALLFLYLIGIYTGYSFINYEKKKAAEKAKKAKIRVKFLKRVKEGHEEVKKGDFVLYSKDDNEEMIKKISKYFIFIN